MKKYKKVGILLHPDVSVSSAMLIKDIFERTGARFPDANLQIRFVIVETFISSEYQLKWTSSTKHFNPDILVIPPVKNVGSDLKESLSKLTKEIEYLKRLSNKQVIMASACLGAFLLAEAGLLNKKKATTHWAYAEYARHNYPNVHWQTHKVIELDKNIITGGGYLTMVDLVFFLIENFVNKKVASEMAKRLLVDSARQSQALYMIRKTGLNEKSPFQKKAHLWFERNYKHNASLRLMAQDLAMSERTLHRRFISEFSMAPNQWIQSQRVEKAKALLEKTDLSQEQIVSDIGLSDINSFREIFVRELGLTPAQYRKKVLCPV